MAELLKHVYTTDFIASVSRKIAEIHPEFAQDEFNKTIFDRHWPDKELKARLTFIAQTLYQFLPADFTKSTAILKQAAPFFGGYEAMFFPAFVELYGLDDYHTSIDTLEHLTQYSSSEFAVRPFINKYPEQMMAQMAVWTLSNNEHVRRLASEGCRPRLPWANALAEFKKDPQEVIKILELLKDDSSLYVRRSVANNLNDISKDNPQLVVNIAREWIGKNKHRDWIVKHACRGLLKQGHPEVLALFGFAVPEHINVISFKADKRVKIGETLDFSFSLNSSRPLGKLRIEFVLGFMKKNGKRAEKIFKISESVLNTNTKKVTKQFSFKRISTRKYYSGEHHLTIVVNGAAMCKSSFYLEE
ncbi:DNA alkylation repair protein [Psychromonas ossibalaenae]|uniref:DNA alkylation repair protein n=1 Tax=Psychromonas ossibalaenae TaxID=444922 RepID=UPI0003690289|nr:DNA alkylation repair protein [Psychromonas ossibalaenae]